MNWRYVAVMCLIVGVVAAFFGMVTPSRSEFEQRLAERATAVNWDTVKDDPSQPVSVVWAVRTKADEGAYPRQLLRDRFGLELEISAITSAEAMQLKLPMQLAAGNVPDVFTAGSGSQLRTFARHGFLMPVPYELLIEHAPHLVHLVNTYAPEYWIACSFDGVNYGLPTIATDLIRPRTPLWRKDWLDNVGIDSVPQTLDELEEALRRFRYDDPDGDGELNTYGMSGDTLSWYTMFSEIFGAYGVIPFDWMLKDGQVVWGGVQPETKQALETLRRWYQEGLIHPDFTTDRWYAEASRKLYSGRIGYHNYMSSFEAFDESSGAGSPASLLREMDPDGELVPGVPPVGPEGHQGMRVWGASNSPVLAFGRQMAERPEAVIRMLTTLDAVASDVELYISLRIGERGKHWQWNDPAVGYGSGVAMLPPYDDLDTAEAEGFVDPRFLAGFAPFGGPGGDPEMFEGYLVDGLVKFRNQYRKAEWGMRDVFGKPDEVPGVAAEVKDLIQLQQTVFVKIIRGDLPVSSFDDYVEDWHAQGGKRASTQAHDYFQKQEAVLRKVGAK